MGSGFYRDGHVHGVGLMDGDWLAVCEGSPAFGVGDGQAEVFGVGYGDGSGDLIVGKGYIFQVLLTENGYLIGQVFQGEADNRDVLKGVDSPVGQGYGDGMLAFLRIPHVEQKVGTVIGAFCQTVVIAEGGFQHFGGAGNRKSGNVWSIEVVRFFLALLSSLRKSAPPSTPTSSAKKNLIHQIF